jgi:hypothetical protein
VLREEGGWISNWIYLLATRLSHAGFDLYSAQQAALTRMYSMLNAQAKALSYIHVYWPLAVTSALLLLCFLLESLNRDHPARFKRIDVDLSAEPGDESQFSFSKAREALQGIRDSQPIG